MKQHFLTGTDTVASVVRERYPDTCVGIVFGAKPVIEILEHLGFFDTKRVEQGVVYEPFAMIVVEFEFDKDIDTAKQPAMDRLGEWDKLCSFMERLDRTYAAVFIDGSFWCDNSCNTKERIASLTSLWEYIQARKSAEPT